MCTNTIHKNIYSQNLYNIYKKISNVNPDYYERRSFMPSIEMNSPAPDFVLTDYSGQEIILSQFRKKQHVLLVFNRGFV
jgi:hypothetical protein